jgi:hypothetical protein
VIVGEKRFFPGKYFAIVDFQEWTDLETRDKVLLGKNLVMPSFWGGDSVHFKLHVQQRRQTVSGTPEPVAHVVEVHITRNALHIYIVCCQQRLERV